MLWICHGCRMCCHPQAATREVACETDEFVERAKTPESIFYARAILTQVVRLYVLVVMLFYVQHTGRKFYVNLSGGLHGD